MTKTVKVMILMLAASAAAGAQGFGAVVRFDGGIGVIPASSVANPVNTDGTFQNVRQNVVRGVLPAGVPWRIVELKGEVLATGRILLRGRGLLVAGGNSAGQNANQSVFATLICETAAPFVERSTAAAGVPLDANGDFRIDEMLGSFTPACASPVLLIRSSASGAWFAAGVPTFVRR